MTIYIAARYNEKERNEKIALALRKQGFSSILPRKFRMRSDTREKSKFVYNECLKALDRSSTLLVVSPFGRDVAFEIGYYQHLRSISTDHTRAMRIVRFNTDTTRAIQDDMISNVIDYESDDFKEICNYLSRYETKSFPISNKRKRTYKKKFRSDAELRVS